MDVILNVINKTCKCLEDICNNIECKMESACCQTYKHVHLKESDSDKNLDKNNELKNDFKKSALSIE